MWTSGSGAIYRRLKEESYTPLLTFMGRLVHAPATSLQEMDGLMHDIWQLINCKYTVDGKRDAANFVCRYGCHVRRVPMLVGATCGTCTPWPSAPIHGVWPTSGSCQTASGQGIFPCFCTTR